MNLIEKFYFRCEDFIYLTITKGYEDKLFLYFNMVDTVEISPYIHQDCFSPNRCILRLFSE